MSRFCRKLPHGHLNPALLALTLAAMAPWGSSARSEGVSPQVVETTPTLMSRDVDPSITQIEVRFDRPMSPGSWSWCGGGGAYPELTGKPFFRDATTAVLPVKLRPQHSYRLSINCSSARNFRSADGEPAEITPMRFTTGSGTGYVDADPDNYASWLEFRKLFETRYSYYERTGTDWNGLFDESQDWVMTSPTPDEWGQRVATLLQAARDPHLYLRGVDNARYSTWSTGAVHNGNRAAIERAIPGIVKKNDLVEYGWKGRIGYLAVHSWSNGEKEMDAIDPAMELMKDTPALIVDVRGNGGGGEDLAKILAGWFVEQPAIYEKHRSRMTNSTTGWSSVRDRWVQPNPQEKRYKGKIFLLQGPVCLSSNESFIAMMKQSPRVTTIGERTGGSSANPKPHKLPNKLTLVLPSWQAMLPDGSMLEGVGIPPDVEIKGDFEHGDPVLEEAFRRAEAIAPTGS